MSCTEMQQEVIIKKHKEKVSHKYKKKSCKRCTEKQKVFIFRNTKRKTYTTETQREGKYRNTKRRRITKHE